jgi:hypothetical protein
VQGFAFDELLVFAGLMATLGSLTKIVLALAQRRKGVPDALPAALNEISQRLAHLEQAVDTTALEVERIAEGQRFTTRLLADRNPSAAGGGGVDRARVTTPH